MAIVNYNSLAALYNIRQKFETCPTRNALGLPSIFLVFNHQFQNHLERKALFLLNFNFPNLVCVSIFKFHFSPNIPQNSCRREMVSMCQRACQGKLPVGFCTDADSQFCQPKGSGSRATITKTHHPAFTAIQWSLECSGWNSNAGNRAECCRTSTLLVTDPVKKTVKLTQASFTPRTQR